MKLVKLFNKLSAVALAASLVVGFASCSTTTDDPFNPNAPLTLEEYVKSEIKKAIENGGAQAKPEDPSKPGKPSGSGSLKEPKSLEFHVNANSTNAENTMIFVKYDRSAYGAEEEVKVNDAELNLYINDVKVKTYNEIVFALDEYGAGFDSRGPIEDSKAMKEYKAKLNVGKEVKSGDTVKIELVKASVVKVGAASDKITLANLQFALIDTDPFVDYYKELAPNEEQFRNICTLEDLTTGEDTESKPGENPTPTPDEKPEPGEESARPAIGDVVYSATGDSLTVVLPQNIYGDPAISHGIQVTKVGILPKGAKAGETYKIVLKGTASGEFSANVQFLNKGWQGLGDEATVANFTTEDFNITAYYTFGFDTEDGYMFVIGNDDAECTEKTLTLTEFSITRENKPAGGEEPTPTPDPEPTPDPKPEDSGLLSKAADLDWGTPVSVAGSSFASATDDSSIKITYVSNKDTAQYYKFKMMCGDGNENELFAGEATGFTIDTESENENDLHGCDFAAAPSETPAVITYKPSTEEWAKIKAGEFRLIGYGAKITKIELGTAAPGGDSVVFDDAISSVVLSPNNWEGKDHGIQYHVANASLFPDGIEAGDKYKFEMTGSVTGGPITQKFIIVIDNDTYNPNNVQNYFVNDPDVSGKSAKECLSEGITVTMTFDAAIESSKVVLWIYTEGPGTAYDEETTASKTATIDFSSFKITKVE